MNLTFVVACNDETLLKENLLASPCFVSPHTHQIIVQKEFPSAAAAYNAALEMAINEIIVFVHQDVFLPQGWLSDLQSFLNWLADNDPNWGVLGCWGVRRDGSEFGYLYTPGQGVIGRPLPVPEIIQTLDEVVLILRKSSGLRFSQQLSGFHFYGTDICLSAAKSGRHCYAISAFCIHNSRQYFALPPDFYASYKPIKRLWKDYLPIQTSCIRISRFDVDLWRRRVKELCHRFLFGDKSRGPRSVDPRIILEPWHG
jgi:hypothetical protein